MMNKHKKNLGGKSGRTVASHLKWAKKKKLRQKRGNSSHHPPPSKKDTRKRGEYNKGGIDPNNEEKEKGKRETNPGVEAKTSAETFATSLVYR